MTPPPPALPAAPEPSTADFDAYARGTRAEIRLLRRALRTGDSITWPAVDSVAAQATGMSIERFHAVSATVESSLREKTATAERQRLDSLRVELMVLRVRLESQP